MYGHTTVLSHHDTICHIISISQTPWAVDALEGVSSPQYRGQVSECSLILPCPAMLRGSNPVQALSARCNLTDPSACADCLQNYIQSCPCSLPYHRVPARPEKAGAVGERSEVGVDQLLELVVDDQHQGTASSTQHIGPGSLQQPS